MDRAAVLSRAEHFPLEVAQEHRGTLALIRQRFEDSGYTEPTLLDLLGLDEVFDPKGALAPILARYCLSLDVPGHALIQTFFLGLPVPAPALAAAFSGPELELLLRLRLLETQADGSLQAPVVLYPFAGLLIATDWGVEPDPDVPGIKNRVMYLGADSCLLARLAAARAGERCLDLGTGSGVIALAAAACHEQVVGVDISPRAVNFARFNALLNGIDNCTFLLGDLFEPVAGLRFDHLVANPPFVACPGLGSLLFRDGGRAGEEVLSRLIAGCPEHLHVGGTAVVRTDLATHLDRDYHDKLKGWLRGGAGFDAVTLASSAVDPYTYAAYHNGHLASGSEAWKAEVFRWIDSYLAEGIEEISPGFIVLRRRSQGPYRGRSLAVDDAFGRQASFVGFCEGLLERLERLAELDWDNTRLEVHAAAGTVELARRRDWPGLVRVDYRLLQIFDDRSADGFLAADFVEAVGAAGGTTEGGGECAAAEETMAALFLAGHVRPRPARKALGGVGAPAGEPFGPAAGAPSQESTPAGCSVVNVAPDASKVSPRL